MPIILLWREDALQEDFNDFYSPSNPDKIKVFQALKLNLDEFKHDYDEHLQRFIAGLRC